jgi:L-arabinokinase
MSWKISWAFGAIPSPGSTPGEVGVEAVRRRGPQEGLYGAKITGGGTGGTVAVLCTLDALNTEVPKIAVEYSRRVGVMPDIFEGTSPGAMEFGARRYVFGATGWTRHDV